MSPKSFSCGGRVPPPPHPSGISSNTPFTEAWRLSVNSRDMEDKTLRVSSEPFKVSATAHGGRLFSDYQHTKNMAYLKKHRAKMEAKKAASERTTTGL